MLQVMEEEALGSGNHAVQVPLSIGAFLLIKRSDLAGTILELMGDYSIQI